MNVIRPSKAQYWSQLIMEQKPHRDPPEYRTCFDGRAINAASRPEVSHSQCGFVEYKSYHFIRGKIYKCGPAALLPEFDEQHNLDISEEDRKIVHGYQPLTLDNFENYRDDWVESLKNPIPQCKFCPENPRAAIITPTRKGSAFKINT